MKINKKDIPVTMESPGTIMRAQPDFGGMTICFNEVPKGTDFSPLLAGLENDSCHCPHWGYVIKGSILIKYDNGTEELITEGDVFYLPSGHTGIVQEDLKYIEFNPAKEFNEVMTHISHKIAEMG